MNQKQFPGIEGAFGTSDIIARCGNEIFVLDWKFGRGVVPAEENKQLMFYTAGALNTARDFFKGMTLNHETLEHELNLLGVLAPRPEKPAPAAPTDNGWYKRGEPCPF
jgi:hypothetical protein